jgi:hypothetical protein
MEVDAEIFYWTEVGMRKRGYGEGYITVKEVERLLEEADERRRVFMKELNEQNKHNL